VRRREPCLRRASRARAGSYLERSREKGQHLERLGDAQFLLRGAPPISEEPFDVFAEAAKPQVHVRVHAQRAEQPAALFRIERRSLPRQARKRGMRRHPVVCISRRERQSAVS